MNSSNERPSDGLSDSELIALQSEVDEALERGFRRLRFPGALEQVFERETGAARARYMLISGLVGLVVNNFFLFSDYTMIPDVFGTVVFIRLGIQAPLWLLGSLALTRGLSPRLREGIGAVINLVGSLGLSYALSLSHDPNASYYFSGLILVMMFHNVVYRLRFWYALADSLSSIMFYAVVSWRALHVPEFLFFNSIIALCSSAIISLFANYALEQGERRSYLLNVRERIQRATLAINNIRLAELAHLDPLTGIANRRELEEYLNGFQQHPPSRRVAIVMLDIDFFKSYNDLYGHPAGDECLRRVAGALSQSLRKHGDIVARYGGEEFIVVMPGQDRHAAEQVAERMRQAVMHLGIPHRGSHISEVVTISAGVASSTLGATDNIQTILAAADAALYRAKSAGRNRVA